jgi:hypothetical protein
MVETLQLPQVLVKVASAGMLILAVVAARVVAVVQSILLLLKVARLAGVAAYHCGRVTLLVQLADFRWRLEHPSAGQVGQLTFLREQVHQARQVMW